MRAVRSVAALIAVSSLAGQALAAAADPVVPPCVTRAEVRAGLAFIVPTLLNGLKAKCVPLLPSSAFMATRGDDFEARFKATASQNPESLRAVVGKVMPDAAAMLGSPAMMTIVAGEVTKKMQADIKPAACPKIDAALALLDPLPTENVIGLLEIAVVEMASERKRGTAPKMTICPAVAAK